MHCKILSYTSLAENIEDIAVIQAIFTQTKLDLLDTIQRTYRIDTLIAPVCVAASRFLNEQFKEHLEFTQLIHLWEPAHHCFNFVKNNNTGYIVDSTYLQFFTARQRKKLPEISIFPVKAMPQYKAAFLKHKLPTEIFGLWAQGIAEYRLYEV